MCKCRIKDSSQNSSRRTTRVYVKVGWSFRAFRAGEQSLGVVGLRRCGASGERARGSLAKDVADVRRRPKELVEGIQQF